MALTGAQLLTGAQRREELAWAAGFFDGEGHVRANATYGCSLAIAQVPIEPLVRFQRAVGCGRIEGPRKRSNPNHADIHEYVVSTYAEVQAVVAQLWGFLSEPKREQARQALLKLRVPRKKWQQCQQAGHRIRRERYGDGTRLTHRCVDCSNQRANESRWRLGTRKQRGAA